MEKKGFLVAIDVFVLLGMLETLWIIKDVDKVHQKPQKPIIDLNVVPCEDNTGAKTLSAYIQALLLVPHKGSSIHEANKL